MEHGWTRRAEAACSAAGSRMSLCCAIVLCHGGVQSTLSALAAPTLRYTRGTAFRPCFGLCHRLSHLLLPPLEPVHCFDLQRLRLAVSRCPRGGQGSLHKHVRQELGLHAATERANNGASTSGATSGVSSYKTKASRNLWQQQRPHITQYRDVEHHIPVRCK